MRTRILGYVFDGQPVFNTGYNRRNISFVFPINTDDAIIDLMKTAEMLEVLGNNGSVVATYPLHEWTGTNKIYDRMHSGIAVSWATTTLDETDDLKSQIADLKAENESLTEENRMLENAVLELAEIIGDEGESEE